MNRRTLMKTSLLALAAVGTSGTAVWFSIEKSQQVLNVDAALTILQNLSRKDVLHSGEWNPYQIFSHCAQSIEFSMQGFPEHKSQVFKNTVGSLAFSAFYAKGRMHHGLNEGIPGASIIEPQGQVNQALVRLIKAFNDFKAFNRPLAPHFAYGELSKHEYELAHVMHLYNHLQEITVSDIGS